MSLHRQSQCQRAHRQETADSCRSPLLLSGDICPYLLATGWSVASGAAPRPVNRPLGPSVIRVNNLFAILFQKLLGAPEIPGLKKENGGESAEFKGFEAERQNRDASGSRCAAPSSVIRTAGFSPRPFAAAPTSPVIRRLAPADYALFAMAELLLPLLAFLNGRRFARARRAIRAIRFESGERSDGRAMPRSARFPISLYNAPLRLLERAAFLDMPCVVVRLRRRPRNRPL